MLQETGMMTNKTWNVSTQQFYDVEDNYYRCRGCNQNLASNSPESLYQKQKLIQKTVRVPASLYLMNLAGLNVYEPPNSTYRYVQNSGSVYVVSPGTNWNQMSDRAQPHIQKNVGASGSTYGGNSLKRSLTRLRPGALSPGGEGVDIKHNSYERYLNRIKGKSPLRRGKITDAMKEYAPFNLANPIYGGKTFKLAIVNHCNCPITDDNTNLKNILSQYPSTQDKIYSVKYSFHVGDYIWTSKTGHNGLYKAKILTIIDNNCVVQFNIDNAKETKLLSEVFIDYDCKCKDQLVIEDANTVDSSFFTKSPNTSVLCDNSVFTISSSIL